MLFEFTSPKGDPIRVFNDCFHKTWFLAKDICEAVNLAPKPHRGYLHHLKGLDEDDVEEGKWLGIKDFGIGGSARWISESAIRKVITQGNTWWIIKLKCQLADEILPKVYGEKVKSLINKEKQ